MKNKKIKRQDLKRIILIIAIAFVASAVLNTWQHYNHISFIEECYAKKKIQSERVDKASEEIEQSVRNIMQAFLALEPNDVITKALQKANKEEAKVHHSINDMSFSLMSEAEIEQAKIEIRERIGE